MDEDQSLEIEITDGGYSEEEINAAAEAQQAAQEVQEQYRNDLEQQELQNQEAQKQLLIDQEKNRKANIGDYAKEKGHRLTFHPGQFNNLGSPRQKVVEQTFKDLEYHADVLDLMGLDNNSVMVVHGGGVDVCHW